VSGWRDVANFASGWDADLAIARLNAAGIDALRDNNVQSASSRSCE